MSLTTVYTSLGRHSHGCESHRVKHTSNRLHSCECKTIHSFNLSMIPENLRRPVLGGDHLQALLKCVIAVRYR